MAISRSKEEEVMCANVPTISPIQYIYIITIDYVSYFVEHWNTPPKITPTGISFDGYCVPSAWNTLGTLGTKSPI